MSFWKGFGAALLAVAALISLAYCGLYMLIHMLPR